MEKFKTPYNLGEFPKPEGEVNILPSLTVPDMALSVQQIAERYVTVEDYPAGRVPFYSDIEEFPDGEVPNLATLDISEKHRLIESTQRYMEQQRKLLAQAREKRNKEMKGQPPAGDKGAPSPSGDGE